MNARRRQRRAEPREYRIESLSHEGRGIARVNGKTVFVFGALPGERVLARVTQSRRKFDQATTLEVLEASPRRIEPRCSAFRVCGGCSLQHLSAEDQLEHKQSALIDMMAHARIDVGEIMDPIRGEPWGYRHMARLAVKHVPGKGRVLVGFRERDKPYVADMLRCEVLLPRVGLELEALSSLISDLESRACIPQIEVAAAEGKVQLVFRHLQPLSDSDLGKLRRFAEKHDFYLQLQSAGPESVQDLFPDNQRLAFDPIGNGRIRIAFRATDFVQVNDSLNRRMVAQALAELDLAPHHQALDLFCGLGNFTLPIALSCKRVLGIEGDSAMVGRAREAAVDNGIDNAEFQAADLSGVDFGIPWMRRSYDRLLLDPPRSGAAELAGQIDRFEAGRIVYISCQPSSLVRDATLICGRGYRLARLGVIDMFPQTAHVESMAVFVPR